jgi:hypothetical protein
VTVAVSAWLPDERITPAFAAGSLLVLVGVYIGALRRPSLRREADAGQETLFSGDLAALSERERR